MITCLDEILEGDDSPGLISHYAPSAEEVIACQIRPLCLIGIFNPFGPTLVALTHLTKDSAPFGALLYTSLNPFSQTRLITAKLETGPDTSSEVMQAAYRVGDNLLINSLPDFVLPSAEDDAVWQNLCGLLYGLALTCRSPRPIKEIVRKYREHWTDPWSRLPSMAEMLATKDKPASAPMAAEELSDEPSLEDFNEWISTVTDYEHVVSEMRAVLEGWSGSIKLAENLPHMSAKEMAAELSALGFPHFKSAAK